MSENGPNGPTDEEIEQAYEINKQIDRGELRPKDVADKHLDRTEYEYTPEVEERIMAKLEDILTAPFVTRRANSFDHLLNNDTLLPVEVRKNSQKNIDVMQPVDGFWVSIPVPFVFVFGDEEQLLDTQKKKELDLEVEKDVIFKFPVKKKITNFPEDIKKSFEKIFMSEIKNYPELLSIFKEETGDSVIYDFSSLGRLFRKLIKKRGLFNEELGDVTKDLAEVEKDKLLREYEVLNRQLSEIEKKSLLESGVWLYWQKLFLTNNIRFQDEGHSVSYNRMQSLVLMKPDIDIRLTSRQSGDYDYEWMVRRGIKRDDVIGLLTDKFDEEKPEDIEEAQLLELPYYSNSGDLIWPKQMSHEEVKQFIAERDSKKK